MKSIQRKIIIGLLASVLALTGLSCTHGQALKTDEPVAGPDHARILEKYQKGVEDSRKVVVARVNAVPVTMYDLISRMNQIAPSYLAHEMKRSPEIDQEIKKDALDILIFRELAVQEAVRQGLRPDAEKVDAELSSIKESLGSDEAYQAYLRRMSLTEDTVKKVIARNQLFELITRQEIYQKTGTAGAEGHAADDRKLEWEAELKKNARIELLLEEVEKQLRGGAGRQPGQ